ncbi:MAG: type I-E CRISPR-associated protein Cse2/CasB [Chloroflexi bacterium]|nr:type I-E CRISPR-associated protein Cse2/CasB [Chloroflexota bacterium]MCL5110888.1 type I-E CRISPR-associated protein Cse2/CasB [Chloroflexota bacterium]
MSPPRQSWPTEAEKRFAGYLAELASDEEWNGAGSRSERRAALHALKRGLRADPGLAPETWRHVNGLLADDLDSVSVSAHYLVASLFATHQLSWEGERSKEPTNFGASFARLRDSGSGPTLENRFVGLLKCRWPALPAHLRRAVGLMRTRDMPILIDWAQLLHDLRQWQRRDKAVQREWARAYWREFAEKKPPLDVPAEIAAAEVEV